MLRKFFLGFTLLVGIVACNNGQESGVQQQPEKVETLPPSIRPEKDILMTTGEVVVFFQPAESSWDTLKITNPEDYKRKSDFRTIAGNCISQLKEEGVTASYTEENVIAMKITPTEDFMIQAPLVKSIFSVAVSKQGMPPQIIKGFKTQEDYILEIKKILNTKK
jgi:hypothetical protein